MNNRFLFKAARILTTLLLICSGIFCILGGWWRWLHPQYAGIGYTDTTFFDAVAKWANSALPFGITLFAVFVAIVLLWTKAYKFTLIPTIIIAVLVGITYFTVLAMQKNGTGVILPLGTVHFVTCDILFLLSCALEAVSVSLPKKNEDVKKEEQ